MKVYVVTTGEYSDYTIQGIYDSSEKAEYVRTLLEKHHYSYCINDVEEWEVNTPLENDYFFKICYNLNTNEVTYILYQYFDANSLRTNEYYDILNNKFYFDLPYSERIDNEEIIKKIAYDKYAEYKARTLEF